MATKKKVKQKSKTQAKAILPENPARAAFREYKQTTGASSALAQATGYPPPPAFGFPPMGAPQPAYASIPAAARGTGIVDGIGSTLSLAINLVNAGLANGVLLLNQTAGQMDPNYSYGQHSMHQCHDDYCCDSHHHHDDHYYHDHQCHDCCDVLGGYNCNSFEHCSSVGNCC